MISKQNKLIYIIIFCLIMLTNQNKIIKSFSCFIIFLLLIELCYSKNEKFVDTINIDPLWNTIDKTGIIDATSSIITIFNKGGNIFIPNGTYLIDGKGDDTGGIEITLKKDTIINCDTNVKFVAGLLDNDMIRFNCNTPNINFEWYGGTFYQDKQKNSSVLPFSDQYKTKNSGKTATADGLSIRGNMYNINKCIIDGVTFYGADNTNKLDTSVHWEKAGGDSGLYAEGIINLIVRNCKCVGNRDCGIYTSSNPNGTYNALSTTLIENNKLINCFHGIASKRSSSNVTISKNDVTNCVRGICIQYVLGVGSQNINIKDNTGTKCNIFIQIQNTNGYTISNNKFTYLGSVLPDNKTIITAPNAAYGIDIDKSNSGTINNNSVSNITSGLLTSNLKSHVKLFRIMNNSSNNTFIQNTYTGLKGDGKVTTNNNKFS